MKTPYHALLSLPVFTLTEWVGSQAAVLFVLANTLIDADHVLNFWLSEHRVEINLLRIYRFYVGRPRGFWYTKLRAYYPFHAFELVVALGVASWSLGLPWGLPITAGMGFHLCCDIVSLTPSFYRGSYRVAFRSYWFACRLAQRFAPV